MVNKDLDNKIFDLILTKELWETDMKYLRTIPPEEELKKKIHLSDDFKRKMDELRRGYSKK